MLLRFQLQKFKLHSCLKALAEHVALLIILILNIHRHKAVEDHLGSSHCEYIFSRLYLHGSSLVTGGGHPAGSKALPDQLIKPELIPGQRIL